MNAHYMYTSIMHYKGALISSVHQGIFNVTKPSEFVLLAIGKEATGHTLLGGKEG